MMSKTAQLKSVTVAGKRFFLVPAEEYKRLTQQAVWEPIMPEPDAAGKFPAMEAMSVALARDILRARRKLGLSQTELARLAGIRPETLNRIEQGKHKPSVPTIDKIDRALKLAEQEESKKDSGRPR
jgi:ribosome-binding protein aMBF1 (putative translation factor)